MKITVIPIVFIFLTSVLIIPIGVSYATYGDSSAFTAPGAAPGSNQTVTPSTPNNRSSTITPGTTGSVVGGIMAYMAKASDGTVVVVRAAHPISGQPLALGIAFKGNTGNFVQHQNYAMNVTQNNATVLSVSTGHTHTGTDTQTTFALTSSNPITIHVTLNGVGLPTADPSTWTGVKGEVLSFGQAASDTTMVPSSNMTTTTSTPTASTASPSQSLSPLKQFKSGVTAKSVQCQSGFSLVLKAEDSSPACVHSSSVQILIQRGWAAIQ